MKHYYYIPYVFCAAHIWCNAGDDGRLMAAHPGAERVTRSAAFASCTGKTGRASVILPYDVEEFDEDRGEVWGFLPREDNGRVVLHKDYT